MAQLAMPTSQLEPSLVALLHVGAAWSARVDSALRQAGLSPAGYWVLHSLARAGGSGTPAVLADAAAIGSSTLTPVIDTLEATGMVDRTRDPHDGRTIRVQLTALGRDRQSTGARLVDAVARDFETVMPVPDRVVLGSIISRLI